MKSVFVILSLVAVTVLCRENVEATRVRRQIGYGATGAGLQSKLSGISSGYGYGYNNAVGLAGLGNRLGSGTYVAPVGIGYGGLGGYGGGYGGLGGVGYGGYGGYGGLNGGLGGYGTGYGLNTGLTGGIGSTGAGWGSAPAVAQTLPMTSAIVPTVAAVPGASAYGRSDDMAAPQVAPVTTPVQNDQPAIQPIPTTTTGQAAVNQSATSGRLQAQ